MSESWQDWSSEEYREFLTQFYREQIDLARYITGDVHATNKYKPITIAVFEKVAPPSHFIEKYYESWLKDKGGKASKAEPVGVEPPTSGKWKPTKTVGTMMCSERDVTDEELRRAKDTKDASMWYSKPGAGYRWGLVFKKVPKR